VTSSVAFVRGRWWSFFGRGLVLAGLSVAGIAVLSIPVQLRPESRALDVVMSVPVRMMYLYLLVCATHLYLLSTERDVVDEF